MVWTSGAPEAPVGTCPIGSVALLMGSQPNETIAELLRAVVQVTATCSSSPIARTLFRSNNLAR
ncbi:hypothetical protein GCM10017774_80780 [Lentzea cavernae]|uniref:Uncharacterized protein n=1 Tax=Lentzea cavernae TaxID=2020703 RepID=A0ABQ3MRA0_9PSEU|nr:hypothetical protein GCM10017774_80780 [Lentzea cavernae]